MVLWSCSACRLLPQKVTFFVVHCHGTLFHCLRNTLEKPVTLPDKYMLHLFILQTRMSQASFVTFLSLKKRK